jgi:hypothetical protein
VSTSAARVPRRSDDRIDDAVDALERRDPGSRGGDAPLSYGSYGPDDFSPNAMRLKFR